MGSIFSAYDIRGHAADTLTVEYAWTVGKAFSEWLPEQGDVVVFKEQNAHGDIAHGFVEGMLLQGRNIIDGGYGDKAAVIAAINDHKAVGGALVSHDEVQNLEIIALFDGQGSVVDQAAGLLDVQQLADSGNFLPAAEKGHIKSIDS
jgi:phosphomannomutase